MPDATKTPTVWNFATWKDTPATVLARVRQWGGGLMTEQAVDEVYCTVVGERSGQTYHQLIPQSSITDLSGTEADPDPRWENRAIEEGFNFEYKIPADAFPAVEHVRVEFTFRTLTTGSGNKPDDIMLILEGPVRSRQSPAPDNP